MDININLEEKLINNGEVSFHPMGSSMWPLFVRDRDVATIKQLKRKPRRGDVIVYRSPKGPLIIHRVHHTDDKGVYYVGDHQTELEGPNDEKDIVGIMTSFVRLGKHYSVSNIFYIIVSRSWLLLRPVRWKLINAGSKMKQLVKRRKNDI